VELLSSFRRRVYCLTLKTAALVVDFLTLERGREVDVRGMVRVALDR